MSNDVKDRSPIISPETRIKPVLKRPELYWVFMTSSQEGFVWREGTLYAPKVCFEVLREVFGKADGLEHTHLWQVYYKGISLVFNGTFEVVETKTLKANDTLNARSGEYEPIKHFKFTFESQY